MEAWLVSLEICQYQLILCCITKCQSSLSAEKLKIGLTIGTMSVAGSGLERTSKPKNQ